MTTANPAPIAKKERTIDQRVASASRLMSGILFPHLVMIASQLPLTIAYFYNLWRTSPHYRFFPFLMLAVAYLIYSRFPRKATVPFVRSPFANGLMVIGVFMAVAATAFVNPSFSAISMVFLGGSLLCRTRDTSGEGTLTPVWLLTLLAIQPPFNLDLRLIVWLQHVSAKCTSLLLDLLGYAHNMPGTVLVFPDRSFFVEEACSGVQSFFTLMFCSALYAVWTKRSALHSIVLVLTALFWAVMMNISRILLIPIFHVEFGIDLANEEKIILGVLSPHDILGYVVLIFAVLMIASTDRFLSFALSPVPLDRSHIAVRFMQGVVNIVTFRWLTKRIRNRRERREINDSDIQAEAGAMVGKRRFVLYWGIAGVLILGGLVQSFDAVRMLGGNYRVSFGLDTVIDLEEGDLPIQVDNWRCVSYQQIDRARSSELGQRSDNWSFEGTSFASIVSLDQPFPGWHELSQCYTGQGWKILDRKTISDAGENGSQWPYVEVEMENPLGERGYLVFSFFDLNGEAIQAPDDTGPWGILMEKIKNRLNYRIREQLFQGEVYQAQVFVHSARRLSERQKDEVRHHYFQIRKQLRDRVVESVGSSS